MMQTLFSFLLVFILTLCFVSAGQGAMQKYQKEKFITLAGEVEQIYTASPPGTKKRGLHLRLQTAVGVYTIHVCPQWYVDEKPEQFNFNTGDMLLISGAQFSTIRTDKNVYAASIFNQTSGAPELRLRDPDTGGFILWAGRFKGEIKGVVLNGLEDKIKKLQENIRLQVLSSYNRDRKVQVADDMSQYGIGESYSYIP